MAKEAAEQMDKQIRLEAYSGCYWCGVPQEICIRWEDNGRGRYQRAREGDCQDKGVLTAGLAGVGFGFGEVGRR